MPVENKANIYRAMVEISYRTPFRFVERTTQKNYVYFTPSSGSTCASSVGRRGGKQVITLAPRCKKGSTMHEILHALGLWHEQARGDRDNFVDIRWENIIEEKKGNFAKHDTDGLDIGEYDYGSIMHYSGQAFSKNGQPTIVPLISGKKIGQRDKLSAKDIQALKEIYG